MTKLVDVVKVRVGCFWRNSAVDSDSRFLELAGVETSLGVG